ncbi:hypothetical protein [Clostridium fallax]|uniref:CopG family transcriptional regulator / antitoxin EndoAI n=1 Tax=Clostridium fallax TaxID=1533 RepID=A0A1M4VMI9_9CLOT|nr:hypothetical protein [Clostridium fallax]SHE70118.1 hypothetical protein SAMN05443638_10853 [Clostridium fallax]SQB22795.1 CopG-family transcriptional regulator [Clostridium fallax]
MSYSKEIKIYFKNNNLIEKNSQFNDEDLILYNNKEENQKEFYEAMKNGYEQMADINTECAEYGMTADCQSFNEYEAWLFGV